MNKILNCPCCGGKSVVRREKFYMPKVAYNVICKSCYTNSGWYKTEDEAIKNWNKTAKRD